MLQLKTGKSIAHLNQEHQDFFPTLIRYMSSLGLRKDAEGFAQLTDADLNNIFNGIPSVVYAEGGVKSRLARITMELQKHLEGADPNGSTIQQRIEYWRTGWDLIKKHPVFGVGVGDVQDAFNQQYELNQTRLFEENRLHSHQQFATIWISVGIVGLLIFLMNILLTIQIAFRLQSILLYLFVIIITFSYFFEDTLETQVGVSLAAFFLSFLLKQEQRPFFEEKNKASL
jgi:O-antigen ligase